MKKSAEVARTYSYLWNKEREGGRLPASHHYDRLQEAIPFPIVNGTLGIDAGCGNGYDLRLMAMKHPDVNFIGLDVSDGIYNAKENCKDLGNVRFVKGSLLDLPFKDGVFNFAYSFGVIHHTIEPKKCFTELKRALDENGRLIVYLYEKHKDNPLKYHALKVVRFMRLLSARMPKKLLYILCLFCSPFVYLLFSVPAKILSFSKSTRRFSNKIPFNFARGPFSLVGDLYDRFGAPIEYRYSREEVVDLFNNASFKDIETAKLKDTAGWIAWGRTDRVTAAGCDMKDISIDKMSDIRPDRLAEFNTKVYKDELNAARFSDKEGIARLWNWKYSVNPASKNTDNFGWLASYKNDLVGQFHIIPTDIKIGNNLYRAAWASDLAVLKEYRNMGIATSLIQRATKEVGRSFSLFLVGGMSPGSYRIFKRNGLIDLGKIPRYVKILDLKAVLNCYGMPLLLSGAVQGAVNVISKVLDLGRAIRSRSINIETVKSLDGEFERFWDSVSAQYKCIAKRDTAFLKWRYLEQPLWPYTILRVKRQGSMKGFAVLREGSVKYGKLKDKSIGIISDILIDPQDRESARCLLNAVAEFFKNKRALLIKCDILNNRIGSIINKAGFIRTKSGNGFMLQVSKKDISDEDIGMVTSNKNWLITSGDADLDFY